MNRIILKTDKELEYFKKIVKGHTTQEIIELFNKKYNKILTKNQIKNLKNRNRLRSGIDTKFKKGQPALNPFPKGTQVGKGTYFKKGCTPHNKKDKGHEYLAKDGHIYIKIGESNYIAKQRYVFEQEYGKIPEGYDIMFLDKNITNYNIDNLALVKRKDRLTVCRYDLSSKDKEVTKTGILTAQLINKTKEIKDGKIN